MGAGETVAVCLVVGVDHGYVVLNRHLGVNDELAALGIGYHNVGAQAPAVGIGHCFLYAVFVAAPEAAALEDIVENHLAPVALHFGVSAQRVGELASFRGLWSG